MRITPYGASRTVTGSCHLLEGERTQLLLDCGMYQGEAEAKNLEPFGFDPRGLDAVVLSHAHLDHVGRLPMLFRAGYRGPVFATQATFLLMKIILEDALKVMEEPLFEEEDLQNLYAHLHPVEYGEKLQIGGLSVQLHNAGHLPGSAFILVKGEGKRLVYSGDLGNRQKVVLPDPDPAPKADLVLVEGTYGDRPHRSFKATVEEFVEILERTLGQGGKVYIPTFAVERAQEVLFHIFQNQNRLPKAPIFLDSPMANRVSRLYPRLTSYLSPEIQAYFRQGINPFEPQGLRYVESVEESKALTRSQEAMVVLAGSGMLSGGRILHHLKHGLAHPKNAVVFVGYQPKGGLGERIIQKEPVRILDQTVQVQAEVHTLGGFSGHAGQDELLDWLEGQPQALLVHGEEEKLLTLRELLSQRGQRAALGGWGRAEEV